MRTATFVLSMTVVFAAAEGSAETVLNDPLSGGSSGKVDGGQFVAGGGWQAPKQIAWDLGSHLIEGGFSVQLSNWNPNSDSPQHKYDKQHIIDMYEAEHGSPHQSDSDSPKTGFFNIRTGAGYDNLFKFLTSTAGFEDRHETRVKVPYGYISIDKTYEVKVEWTAGGDITVFLNGEPKVTHSHGKQFRLRYVFIGTDNAPAGTYGPQHDVIYSKVKVWGVTEVGPPPPPPPGVAKFEPVADTWLEPANPTASHGSDPELRVGGDGRTIYLRFEVKDVGWVQKASVYLTTLNKGYGGSLHKVLTNDWSEAGLTWASGKLPADPAALSSLGIVDIGETYAFDVSPAIKKDGVYTFAIDSKEEDGSGYHSREAAANHPVLEVVKADGPPPPPANSCEGKCGGVAPAGCRCDAGCVQAGQCCFDACSLCGACAPDPVDPGQEAAPVDTTDPAPDVPPVDAVEVVQEFAANDVPPLDDGIASENTDAPVVISQDIPAGGGGGAGGCSAGAAVPSIPLLPSLVGLGLIYTPARSRRTAPPCMRT